MKIDFLINWYEAKPKDKNVKCSELILIMLIDIEVKELKKNHALSILRELKQRFWPALQDCLFGLFSSPEPKAQVSYCRPFSSFVRRP